MDNLAGALLSIILGMDPDPCIPVLFPLLFLSGLALLVAEILEEAKQRLEEAALPALLEVPALYNLHLALTWASILTFLAEIGIYIMIG